ncbi:MAG TPA: 6-pyruvoyl-tetrahydropterin synthase-related protein [Polyangiaceae bacterium]|nr:6-pyruvoyl-tetrahydropterin synthase-related protein [Polyangiaceae bacterium]
MASLARLQPALRVVLVLACLGLASATILWPLTGPDWAAGHYEGMRYLALAEHFQRVLRWTASYPRWLPELYGGHGYPTFVFYQPFVFFLDALWRCAFPPARALWATIWALLVLGGSGAYLLGRRSGGLLWGLTVAGVFLLSPYLYVDLFVRHDLSELSSLMLLPWALFGLLLLLDRTRSGQPASSGPLCLLALSLSALIYAHPIIAILFCLFASPIAVALCWREGRLDRRVAACLVAAAAFALLLSAPYWLPFVLMREEVQLQRTVGGVASHHTVHWTQFFERAWGFGGSFPDSAADQMSFQLGAPHFALALGAALLCRKDRLLLLCFAVYLAAITAMTPWCSGLWQLPVLAQMQFPWRALAITSALQTLVFAAAGGAFARLRSPALQLFAAGALLTAIGAWQPYQFWRGPVIANIDVALRDELSAARWQIQHYSADEFRPKTAHGKPVPLRDARVLTADYGELSFAPESNPSRIVAELRTPKSTWLRLQQLYLPGWQVKINGAPVPDEELRRDLRGDGTMRFRALLPAGARSGRFRIEAGYAGPRGAGVASAMAALGLLGLLGFNWSEQRARSAAAARDQLRISPSEAAAEPLG